MCATVLVADVSTAFAQPSTDAATAQALFEDGKRLMKEGNYATACPKLAESQRLDPGGGTALAVALCYESAGKTATAWSAFNEALAIARKDKRADREAAAAQHIRDLEPKLVRLKITVASPTKGMTIRRDETTISDAQLDTALPIDPGDHVIEANALDRATWQKKVLLDKAGTTTTVQIPALEPLPKSATAAPVTQPPAPTPAPATTPSPTTQPDPAPSANESSFWTTQRTWGAIVGLSGVGVAGVGGVFGIVASSKWSSVNAKCPGGKCPSAADVTANQNAAKSAGTFADLSTVFLILGGAAAGIGTVLFVTGAPSESSSPRAVRITPMFGPQGAGASFGGAF